MSPWRVSRYVLVLRIGIILMRPITSMPPGAEAARINAAELSPLSGQSLRPDTDCIMYVLDIGDRDHDATSLGPLW